MTGTTKWTKLCGDAPARPAYDVACPRTNAGVCLAHGEGAESREAALALIVGRVWEVRRGGSLLLVAPSDAQVGDVRTMPGDGRLEVLNTCSTCNTLTDGAQCSTCYHMDEYNAGLL